jgi:hypothetical protein
VLNWIISRKHKEILNSTKISVTPGMYMRRGDIAQKPLTNGPKRWLVQTKTSWTRVYTRRE